MVRRVVRDTFNVSSWQMVIFQGGAQTKKPPQGPRDTTSPVPESQRKPYMAAVPIGQFIMRRHANLYCNHVTAELSVVPPGSGAVTAELSGHCAVPWSKSRTWLCQLDRQGVTCTKAAKVNLGRSCFPAAGGRLLLQVKPQQKRAHFIIG